MGKMQRTKGFTFERDVVNLLKANGIECKRSTCSFGADIELANGKTISCKRRANGMEWAYQELKKYDEVLFRSDRKPILSIKIWGYNKCSQDGNR